MNTDDFKLFEIRTRLFYSLQHIMEKQQPFRLNMITKHKPTIEFNDNNISIKMVIKKRTFVKMLYYGIIITINSDNQTVCYAAEQLNTKQCWQGTFIMKDAFTFEIQGFPYFILI